MFYVVLYFALTYLVVAMLFGYAKEWLVVRRRVQRKTIVYSLGFVLFLLPLSPYGVVAAQTAFFGNSLLSAVNQSYIECGGMCGDTQGKVFSYKVMWITPWSAEVYIVTPCTGGMLDANEHGRVATVIDFRKTSQGWQYQDYDTPWSDCGSAEGNVFPPDPQGKSF